MNVGHIFQMKKRKNLETKSHKGICLGYSEDSKAYKMFDPSTQDVIIRRDVRFHEISPPPKPVKPHVILQMPPSLVEVVYPMIAYTYCDKIIPPFV